MRRSLADIAELRDGGDDACVRALDGLETLLIDGEDTSELSSDGKKGIRKVAPCASLADILPLSRLPALRRLAVVRIPFLESLTGIEATRLEELTVEGLYSGIDPSALRGHAHLRRLSLSGLSIERSTLELSDLPSLESLTMELGVSELSLSGVPKLVRASLTDVSFAPSFASAPALTTLHLQHLNQSLEPLTALPRLRVLTLVELGAVPDLAPLASMSLRTIVIERRSTSMTPLVVPDALRGVVRVVPLGPPVPV